MRRLANLAGVLAATRSLARHRRLLAVQAEAFLILRRNVEWYWDERLAAPPANTRTAFAGSAILFQRFPGFGWQLHPLANFARLNALIKSRSLTSARGLAEALLPLLAPRGDALALEYLFPYLGGRPGWVSGMATATGMQALARLTHATGDPRYEDAAARMLPTFSEPAPIGVRRQLGAGRSHYLLYSQAPHELVGNGFAQALIGLHDYTALSGDPRAADVLAAGLRQARVGMSRYDTGAWSRYARGGPDSSLHYHRLSTTFLGRLCALAAEQRFCDEADRFRRYEAEPVVVGAIHARAHRRFIGVRFRASKPGAATITLRRRGRVLVAAHVALAGRELRFHLRRPRHSGRVEVRVDAVSPTGIGSRRTTPLTIHPTKQSHR